MFVDTWDQVSITSVVITQMVFGASFAKIKFKTKFYLGKKEILSIICIKFLLVPVSGLFIMRLFGFYFKEILGNKVLSFVLYLHYVAPTAVVMTVLAI